MRILLLNQFYPPDTAATGQLLSDVACALAAAGHEVHVLCSRGLYGGAGDPAEHVERGDTGGVQVHRLRASGRGRVRGADRLCDWGSFYALALRHSVRLGRVHACLALTTPPFVSAVGARLKRLWGTRLVIWAMDLWPEVAEAVGALRGRGLAVRGLRALARGLYARADQIISLGPAMTRRLRGLGVDAQKILEVPNWVPGEVVQPLPWRADCLGPDAGLDGRFVVMYSGNMGMVHEFETILDAARLLQEDDVLFLFVGDGKRRQEIADGARARGLRCVRFMPPQPLGRLSQLLASAHVHLVSMRPAAAGLIVPSKIYGILAAGRPAIMVGPPENEASQALQSSGSGFTVANGRPEEVAQIVRRLRDHPRLGARMGRAARAYYEASLGRDHSVPRIVRALTQRPC